MTKQNSPRRSPSDPAPQLTIAFATQRLLEEKQRTEVVALLSRLLLQVASADIRSEVDDDAP